VLKIDTARGVAAPFGPKVRRNDVSQKDLAPSPLGSHRLTGTELPGDWKWHGGVLSAVDGCIYAIPQCVHTRLSAAAAPRNDGRRLQ
jgi:hypothetical protein